MNTLSYVKGDYMSIRNNVLVHSPVLRNKEKYAIKFCSIFFSISCNLSIIFFRQYSVTHGLIFVKLDKLTFYLILFHLFICFNIFTKKSSLYIYLLVFCLYDDAYINILIRIIFQILYIIIIIIIIIIC